MGKKEKVKYLYFLSSTILVILLTVSVSFARDMLVAGGCVTEYYLMKDLTEQFNSDKLSIEIRKTGNMKGLMHFAEGNLNFAFLSMPHMMLAKSMKMSPEKTAQMESIEIAQEPILIVVNKHVLVDNLSKDQITAIYNGEITNWKEVGGEDMPIKVASLNEKAESGLWAAFKKVTIGMMNNFKGDYVDLKGPSAINNFLKFTREGITYIGYSSYDPSVSKALSINGVEPTMENFKSGDYPLIAKYYLTYNKITYDSVQPFVDFIYSPEGEAIINQKMIATPKRMASEQKKDMGHMNM